MTDLNRNRSKDYLYHNLSIDGVSKQLDFDELVDYLHHLEGKIVDLQRRLDKMEEYEMEQPVMDSIKERARAISEAYEGSYTESGLVAALRELVTQLSYTHLYPDGDHGIGVVNVRDIYAVIKEMEARED